jgi:histidyl-tRNA synthetase
LLTTFGAKEPLAACGFGFGDAVIFELLAAKGLLPTAHLDQSDVEVVVAALEVDQSEGDNAGDQPELSPSASSASLHGAAMQVASLLRASGQKVDLVLGHKKGKWIFKHAAKLGASHVCLVAPDEWGQGAGTSAGQGAGKGSSVAVKDLRDGSQSVVALCDLAAWAESRVPRK